MIELVKLRNKAAGNRRIIINTELTTIYQSFLVNYTPRISVIRVTEIYDFVADWPFNCTTTLYAAVKL